MPPKKKTNTKRSKEGSATTNIIISSTTKEERIQRREEKKLERQERKRLAEEKRDARKLVLLQKKRKRNERGGGGTEQIITSASSSSSVTPSPIGMRHGNERANEHKKQKSSDQNDNDTSNQQLTINGLPADPKGKATKSSTSAPTRRNSNHVYEITMAKDLQDEAAKKQSDENMLWRRCLKAKEEEGGGKKKKKKNRGGGEDRFESMIRQDVIGNELECSEADQQTFNDTLLGPQNVIALQTEALILQLHTTEAIQDAFIIALDYTPRPSFSIDDLLEDLESAAVDLLACISLDENSRQQDGTKCSPNLAKMVNDFHDDAVFKVEVLKLSLRDYRDRMIQYKKNVDTAYKVAKAFYDGVNNVVTQAIIGLFTGNWFDISATDFLAVDVAFPDVDSIFTSIGNFESIDSLWSQMVPNVDDYYGNLAYISDGLKTRFDDMIDGVGDAYKSMARMVPGSLVQDYDPPQYVGAIDVHSNPEEEALLFTLGLFSGIGGGQYDEDQLDMNVPTFNTTEIRNKVTNIELDFEGFQQPDFDFDLCDGFVLADYIFRAYISLRLISKYWSTTSLAMPQIDIRSNKATKNPFRHPVLAAVSFITSPIGGFMIFVTSSAWLIGIIAALYVPLLQQYSSGCMRLGDGTFLTNNLYSFAYNHAYQDGSGLLVEGMDAYDIKRGDSCNARYASSVTLQNNMNANLTAYTNFYQELSQNMGLSRRCVDSNELDSLFQDACCGLETYPECQSAGSQPLCPMDERLDSPLPFELPGTVLNDASCSVEVDGSDWILNDAVFDCESIPTCSIECEPPRKQLLNDASERCGCTFEWYIHSQWMGTALAFVIYLCMNIARVLFFAGLTRILWKQIHPERFTVVATCNSDGALVTSTHVSGNSHQDLMLAIQTKSNKSQDEATSHNELSATLNAKLDRCIRNFYRVGVALLVASIVVNMMWLSFVLLISRSLTPRVWL
ncbi:hypothetical protein QTG54_004954 [Skeletonema marinoi]|uniref:Uncharacterized protein n=1 Tax=Skeletonema marinoi TaxID=267567 RepID=A0AAD8YFY6_9STRA|nr:hypothetical protein QTG54_004954 [Skeletonema marinoi]